MPFTPKQLKLFRAKCHSPRKIKAKGLSQKTACRLSKEGKTKGERTPVSRRSEKRKGKK